MLHACVSERVHNVSRRESCRITRQPFLLPMCATPYKRPLSRGGVFCGLRQSSTECMEFTVMLSQGAGARGQRPSSPVTTAD
eukprot:1193028-Prorocentrum_minimum.AAC.1